MPHYRVLLHGQNFWFQVEGSPQRMGFYTNRFVEEATPEDAEHAAVDLLHAEGKLNPLNERGDPPRVLVDEIEKVDRSDVPAVVQGFTFFPDERAADA